MDMYDEKEDRELMHDLIAIRNRIEGEEDKERSFPIRELIITTQQNLDTWIYAVMNRRIKNMHNKG